MKEFSLENDAHVPWLQETAEELEKQLVILDRETHRETAVSLTDPSALFQTAAESSSALQLILKEMLVWKLLHYLINKQAQLLKSYLIQKKKPVSHTVKKDVLRAKTIITLLPMKAKMICSSFSVKGCWYLCIISQLVSTNSTARYGL